VRRIRNGASKREKAQLHVVRAPDIAAAIMNDVGANARHRLDACKVLDDFSATGPAAAAAAADRFEITIVLNGDTEHYSKLIAVNPHDTDPSTGSIKRSRSMPAAPRRCAGRSILTTKPRRTAALTRLCSHGHGHRRDVDRDEQ
jgi:hypothetical protein